MRSFSRFLMSIVLCGALGLGLAGCREQILYSGLSQREANEMMALLKRTGIDARLALEARGGTLALNVPQGQSVAAVEQLSRAGYPRVKTPTMTELLPKDSWMLSPTEERAKLAYAQSQEMTGTLRQVHGITDVRVHLAPADRNALGQITAQASASVLVRYDADVIGPDFSDSIKSLVANSVAGLSYERVSVLMVPQDPMSVGGARVPALTPAASTVPATATPAAGSGSAPSIGDVLQANWPGGAATKWLAAILLSFAIATIFLRLVRPRR